MRPNQTPSRQATVLSALAPFLKTSPWSARVLKPTGRALLLLLLVAAAACSAREPRPRSTMEATLAMVKSHTLKGAVYNDEFASIATLSATWLSPALAAQLARQRGEDFKSLGPAGSAAALPPWSRAGADYVFVAGIQGVDFKAEDLASKTIRWRLNLVLLDDNRQPLAVIPAQLVEHGKNPRDLIDYFPHLTNWDEVYTAFFTLKDTRLRKLARALKLELSGPAGRIELDFPSSNY